MIVLNCQHADTCLSDYWSGHSLAYISVPVSRDMTFAGLRAALHAEVSQGAFAGNDERARDNHAQSADFDRACHAAINRDVKPAKPGARYPFRDLDPSTDDDCGESVMAFFVFADTDESVNYWLREGNDELEKAKPYATKREAINAYAATARELARYGQEHGATIHIALNADDLAECPDFILSLGARGGVHVDAA